MKKALLIFCLFIFGGLNAQSLIEPPENLLRLNPLPPLKSNIAKTNTTDFLWAIFPFNPLIAVEDSKVYFGFTKEVTIGIIPYGHIGLEYSYIFREAHNNHFRISYNKDIVLEAGDLGGVLAAIGAGYFTDLTKKGFFPQASVSLLLPIIEGVGIMPYTKFRYTIMTNKTESNIFDFSLGLKTSFYF